MRTEEVDAKDRSAKQFQCFQGGPFREDEWRHRESSSYCRVKWSEMQWEAAASDRQRIASPVSTPGPFPAFSKVLCVLESGPAGVFQNQDQVSHRSNKRIFVQRVRETKSCRGEFPKRARYRCDSQ